MSSRAARAAAAAHSVNPHHLTAATKQQIQSRGDRANRNNRNSGVRNVYRDKKRWRAQITERGIAVHIGTFDSVGEADAAVRKVLARISVSLSVALGAPASQPEAQLGWERQCAGSPGGRS
jgi:triphosphoribosyl-dephospho-CoA synthetase